MSNTIRDLSELLTLFADNNSNQITAQDLRDFIVTTESWRFSGSYEDLENLPQLGTLSSQDSNNVTISGGTLNNISEISFNGSINPGINLSADSFSTTKVVIRSSIVDFTSVSENEVFSVPEYYMFLIDSMEILTTKIFGTNISLQARFGSNINSNEYYESSLINNFNVGDRHIIDVAQNAVVSGKIVTFGITTPSSAETHEGVGIINGTLLKIV